MLRSSCRRHETSSHTAARHRAARALPRSRPRARRASERRVGSPVPRGRSRATCLDASRRHRHGSALVSGRRLHPTSRKDRRRLLAYHTARSRTLVSLQTLGAIRPRRAMPGYLRAVAVPDRAYLDGHYSGHMSRWWNATRSLVSIGPRPRLVRDKMTGPCTRRRAARAFVGTRGPISRIVVKASHDRGPGPDEQARRGGTGLRRASACDARCRSGLLGGGIRHGCGEDQAPVCRRLLRGGRAFRSSWPQRTPPGVTSRRRNRSAARVSTSPSSTSPLRSTTESPTCRT